MEHGEFNAVNAVTACTWLAKKRRGSAHGQGRDDRGVPQLLSTIDRVTVRVAPSMSAPHVASIIWGLATLGWQAGDGPMRGALEAAAVRVAPSMKPLDVASIIWGLATRRSGGMPGRGRCGVRWRRQRCASHRA
jgi:hypothetical protein